MRHFAAIVGLGLLACATSGVEPIRARTINESHAGYNAYRQYCASCHGIFADGQGPVAPVLKERPTDLTRLEERHGRPLPIPMLIEYVDGTRPVRAHGPADMPVWGELLFERLPDSGALQPGRRGMILVILDYLESVQYRE